MHLRPLAYLVVSLALGAVSTHVADDLVARSEWAELWFFSVVPAVLDLVPEGWAQAAALATYALQYLAAIHLLEVLASAGASALGWLLPLRRRGLRPLL